MKKDTKGSHRPNRKKFITLGLIILIAIVIFGLYHLFHPADTTLTSGATVDHSAQQVTVASVASLSPNNSSLSVIGKISSENEATILSQSSGEIVSLNKKLGDSVVAGDTIATIENSSQQASVQQAQGAYDAAVANFNQTSGTTALNSNVTSSQASQNAQNTQSSALAALQNAYIALDDAVHTKADTLFTNPLNGVPTDGLVIAYSNSSLATNIAYERSQIEPVLDASEIITTDTKAENTDANISAMIKNAQAVGNFINHLVDIVNATNPNASVSAALITSAQATVAAARTEVIGAISSLAAAKISYDAALAGASTASNSANGGTSGSIAIAQANVQSALGALNAAKAALSKTIIRSPISGKIINLSVTAGDFISSFSQVADVSNPGALKVVTHVSAQDAQSLSAGNKVTVNSTTAGVITQVAPAIDPQTGTIEVDVGLTGDQSGLIDGDSVTVDLHRDTASSTAVTSGPASLIIIPIVALKITPAGPVIFTIDASATSSEPKLLSHPVQIGSILGENIVVTQGLTTDMNIVTDARGLIDGEIVSLKP